MPPDPDDTEHRLVLGLSPDGLDHLDVGWRIWGWRARPPPHAPAMHIFCCSPIGRLAVVLEGPPGRRCFHPDPRLPLAVVLALRAELEQERGYVEACWATDLVMLGWVRVEVFTDNVVVKIYEGTANEFKVDVEVLGVTSATLEAGVEDAWLLAVEDGKQVQMRLAGLIWRTP